MKKRIVVILLILLVGTMIVGRINAFKEIDKQGLDVKTYIDVADEVSNGGGQVSWKQVAAVVAVQYNNRLDQITEEQVQEIAKCFVEHTDGEIRLVSFNGVMENLGFTDREKQRGYDYIGQLVNHGLMPSRLQPTGPYVAFIQSILEAAIENYEEYSILPSITIAQAILESNWGKSILSKEHNNLFGIKADRSWRGERVNLVTTEFNNQQIRDDFRKYDDVAKSVKDHGEFLQQNKRYGRAGVFEGKTYIEQAERLEKAGYSTATNEEGERVYGERLMELIRQYNLQLIDSYVQQIG